MKCKLCDKEHNEKCQTKLGFRGWCLGVLLGVMFLLLSGCSTTKDVQVPVPVPCVTDIPPSPAYRFSPPYDNIFDATKELLGDRELALAHQNELRKLLEACKK